LLELSNETYCLNFSNLVRCGSLIGCRLLAVAHVKAIDAPCRVDQLLLAREKRMASRADFHVQIALFGRTGLEALTARAGHCDLVVLGMNSWFHYSQFLA
jgi:hypothetical protein